MKRVKGLDPLRFVLAFIVLLGHGVFPLFTSSQIESHAWLKYVNGLLGNSFVGIAAVMVFFVISGFVIHCPYSQGKELKITDFYLKRIIRISLPAIAAYGIYHFTLDLKLGVIWSLLCEVIFYIAYPLILVIKSKGYFKQLLIVSFCLSYIISVFYSLVSPKYNGDFHRNGPFVTWIVGLPIWLLGVALADLYSKERDYKATFLNVVAFRMISFLGAFFCSILRFHVHISYVYTLPLFSFIVFFWLREEIFYYADKKEYSILNIGGQMSYSLYLMHVYCLIFIELTFNDGDSLSQSGRPELCLLTIILSLIVSATFFFIIEGPSHKLARSLPIRSTFKNGGCIRKQSS